MDRGLPLPLANGAGMPFWALLASGPVDMRKIDGWQTPPRTHRDQLSAPFDQNSAILLRAPVILITFRQCRSQGLACNLLGDIIGGAER
jgi:hypothetical protein